MRFAPRGRRIAGIQPGLFRMNGFSLGKHYVFTGELEKMSRREAMRRVVNAGGVLDKTVCRTTEYLVVGSFEYCSLIKNGKTGKLKRAEDLKQKRA